MDRQPILLGTLVSLRPMTSSDFSALRGIAADPLLWEQHPSKDRAEEAVFRALFNEGITSGGALTILDHMDGDRIIGTSRYDHLDLERDEVEIGWTFLARTHWGGPYNSELKKLMIDHAFLFVDTVVFRVHSHNFRSQRAVEKLGARRDGTEIDTLGRGENFVYRLGDINQG